MVVRTGSSSLGRRGGDGEVDGQGVGRYKSPIRSKLSGLERGDGWCTHGVATYCGAWGVLAKNEKSAEDFIRLQV